MKRCTIFQKFMNGGHQERNKKSRNRKYSSDCRNRVKAIEIAYRDLEKHTKQIKGIKRLLYKSSKIR